MAKHDTAETIVKFIAKYPPLSLMGRAAETAKCVMTASICRLKHVKEQERTDRAMED